MNKANNGYHKAFVSKKDQFAKTPQWLLKFYHKKFGKFFDPCPANPKFDGLKIKWKTFNYVNPPYIDTSLWLEKAHDEKRETLMLIPFRPHTKYFKVLDSMNHVCYINKQVITFENYDKPFGIIPLCSLHLYPKSYPKYIKTAYVWRIPSRSLEEVIKEFKKHGSSVINTSPGGTSKYINTSKKTVILCANRTHQSDLGKNMWKYNTTLVFMCPSLSYKDYHMMCGTIALCVNFDKEYFRKHKFLYYKIHLSPLDLQS